jgi:hypothetical protein
MRRTTITARLSGEVFRQRRIGWVCAAAAGALVVFPLNAAATPEHGSSRATTSGASGTVYGGATAQDFPVVIETSKNGRKVVKARIAIGLTCTSGSTLVIADGYTAISVNRRRRFSASFGPATNRNGDGTTTDTEGAINGAFNKARTKASGKWSFKLTDRDTSGAVTDTCDSGNISWTAKQ